MTDLLISGGMVLTPTGPLAADVLIRDGLVAGVGPHLEAEGVTVVDAAHCWVGPGFVDIHTHLREPGQEWKEDIASGSAAAAAGGYTAVVAMPNTVPAIDSGHTARFVTERGRAAGLCDVMSAGALTINRAGDQLAHFDDLWNAGVRLFTDDGDSVADAGVLRRAMEYLSGLGGVVAQHAVDAGLASGGQMHEGEVSSRLGMQGIPAVAEEIVIARDLALVELTGCRYHVQHLSTAGGVRLIAEAKRSGLPVTAEVTPHHLAFDHHDVSETDPNFKMMPPLRTPDDVEAVREAIRKGIVDTLATDHAPHSSLEQDVPFEHAPFGVIGLETAAAVLNTHVGLEAGAFFDRMSVAAAGIADLDDHGNLIAAGNVANITVFDPGATVEVERFRSKSDNSPFLGAELRGVVRTTIFRGAIVNEVTT